MKRQIRDSEQGMVSIIVTMIIMGILSLIVVGFAQLARREQREALDKQLSTQAFYAAESGINDALREINNPASTFKTNKTTCDNTGTPFVSKSKLDVDKDVAYTCLLIDRTPSSLEYGAVNVDESTVVPLNPIDPNSGNPVALSSLEISWNRSDNNGSSYYSNSNPGEELAFPSVSDWSMGNTSAAGILRIDLIPASGSLTRDNLSNRMFTVFLYPKAGAVDSTTTVTYQGNNGGQGGSIQKINCNQNSKPRKCKAVIDTSSLSDTKFYIRTTSIYSNSSVTFTGKFTDTVSSTDKPVAFKDGQYVIDSTGKANDVLKRIRVHKSAPNTDYRYPTYAINSVEDICKRLEVAPGRAATATTPAITPIGKDDCVTTTTP